VRKLRQRKSSEHALLLPFFDKRGRVTNYRRAFPTILRLAKDGDALAQNLAGFCFDQGSCVRRNRAKALHWYRLGAKGGSVRAIGNLALMYEEGQGVKRDLRRAFELYWRGAGLGDPWCQCNLGYLYADWKQDVASAIPWWRKAARGGDAKAQFNLGLAYLDGEGVRKNRRWAALWLRRAAAHGHSRARRLLKSELSGPG
jgi:TPR repeat protein